MVCDRTVRIGLVVEDHLDDEVRLVEAAVSAGLRVPLPVRSPDGRVVVTVRGRRWRAHQMVKLGPALVMVTAELAGVAGHALGAFHRLSLPTDRSVTAPASAPVQARWLSSRPLGLPGSTSPAEPRQRERRGAGRFEKSSPRWSTSRRFAPTRHHLADREVPLLLAKPPARDRFQRIIDALA